MNYAKNLDRRDLILAVWSAEFARRMNGAAEAQVGGAVLRLMTESAAKSADHLVEALRLLIEVEFRLATTEDLENHYMTWEKFVACCQIRAFTDEDGFGELATTDHHISNVRICPGDALSAGFIRPDWATHVCWYNR